MLQVICPECRHKMMYDPKFKSGDSVSSKSKRCVYCGHTFKIHSDQKKSRIVKVIKA